MRIRSQIKNNNLALTFIAVIIFSSVNCFAQDCNSKVEIVTNKPDARIYVDTLLIGKEKAEVNLTKGNHLLFIQNSSFKWGQKNIYDTLRIPECGKDYHFNYNMKPTEYSSIQPDIYEYINKNKTENFFSSNAFKILIGSATVLGGVAAYFKIKADRKYDDYLQTKNQSTLDEVDHLDLYSGVAFGLLQINFGYLIYKFLTD
ncbi:MAG: hypothetical protein NTZ27_03335 [Ignavibacteriales bacterium]|nr:hypothetical protein [Ignavibacteriales bacterium]